MKIGFISDIHSNLHALKEVFKKIDSMNIDKLYCCGDTLGYYAFPRECLSFLKDYNVESVLGNHDLAVLEGKTSWFKELGSAGIDFSRKKLDEKDMDFLKKTPYKILINHDGVSFYICHGSPRDNLFEYIQPFTPDETLKKMAKGVAADVIVCGHTHVQMEADVDSQLFLNPGSVGQPRDGISKACFMVFDTENSKASWYRVSYDIKSAAKAVIENKLPCALADRLYDGK